MAREGCLLSLSGIFGSLEALQIQNCKVITHLTSQQEAFPHIGHSDHEARPSLVVGHHRVLAELDCLSSLLGTSNLQVCQD